MKNKKTVKADTITVAGLGRLKNIYDLIPEDRQQIAKDLIKELTFMSGTLGKLKARVRKEGPTIEFINGSQKMTIEHPAMKTYNTLIQRYGTIYKQLSELIPKTIITKNESDNDGFDDFVDERSDF